MTPTADTCPRCGEAPQAMNSISNTFVCANDHRWGGNAQPADPISPAHYQQGSIEAIDAIKSALGAGFADYLRGSIIKYIWRLPHKGGLEDARKAAWYCGRLVEELGAQKNPPVGG